MIHSIRSLFAFFGGIKEKPTSQTGLHLSKDIIINRLPFACPLLFYKELHWAHSFLLYITMTHHLFVLQTEIQMHVADKVIHAHGGTETRVNNKFTNIKT